jgi:hypothetical protein
VTPGGSTDAGRSSDKQVSALLTSSSDLEVIVMHRAIDPLASLVARVRWASPQLTE